MHWFLTSRAVHTSITLGVLLSLVIAVWLSDFIYNTPYQDLLPPNSMIYNHPLAFVVRYWEVYQMHVDYTSAQTAERRQGKVEDVRKRSEYRKAHGLDQDEGVLGGWTAKSEAQAMGPALREGGDMLRRTDDKVAKKHGDLQGAPEQQGNRPDETFVDFEGKLQQTRKKWFGIW